MVIFDQFLYPILNLVKPGPYCLFIYSHYTISLQVALSSMAPVLQVRLYEILIFQKTKLQTSFLKRENDARWLADSYAPRKRKVCFQNSFGSSFFIFNSSEKNKKQEKIEKIKVKFLNEGVEKKWISGKPITCLHAMSCCTQWCIYCASCMI